MAYFRPNTCLHLTWSKALKNALKTESFSKEFGQWLAFVKGQVQAEEEKAGQVHSQNS
jgi:hypothetical protein